MSDEHKFQDVMVDYLRTHTRAYVHCQTSSMMNAGQPDLCIHNNGFTWFIENKYWRNKGLPNDAHTVQGMLRGSQVNVIKHQLWKRHIFSPIVAQIALAPDIAAVCYKDKVAIVKWRDFIKHIIDNCAKSVEAVEYFESLVEKQKDK